MLLWGILVFLLFSSDLPLGLLCSDLPIKQSLLAAWGPSCGVRALHWACSFSLVVAAGPLLLQHNGSVVAACGPSCPRACAVLVLQPGREPVPPELEGRSLTTREVPPITRCSVFPLPSSLTSLCPHFRIVLSLFVCKFVCYHLPLTLYCHIHEGRGHDVLFIIRSLAPGTRPVPSCHSINIGSINDQFQPEPDLQNWHLHSDGENEDCQEWSVMEKANKLTECVEHYDLKKILTVQLVPCGS